MSFSSVEKLTRAHNTSGFDCGKTPLNDFLQRFALASQQSGNATTYVVSRLLPEKTDNESHVVGYYSLTVGAVTHESSPTRVTRGQPRHPIPVMLIARLAVDVSAQGCGLGKALLKDALLRTLQAAEIVGIRSVLVHAKDDEARKWYLGFDFEASPTDPFHLFLLLKDVRAMLGT
jgi:GNAT superfamily N-acetyltransferase